MKIHILISALLLGLLAMTMAGAAEGIEATTAIKLPVDSITIYPDGLVFVRRLGSMNVTVGDHEFVMNVPEDASQDSVLFLVSNSSIVRTVYESMPIYTVKVLSEGNQDFLLSYLMNGAGTWVPNYFIHLMNGSGVVTSNAIISASLGEDLKNIRIKLVAGPTQRILERYADYEAEAAAAPAAAPKEMAPSYLPPVSGISTGEMETLFVFELENRTDLAAEKVVGLPLFEDMVPMRRLYTWDASLSQEGPVREEIVANNTANHPWPAGKAQLLRSGEYLTSVQMPYTPKGSNASIVIGASSDLKVSSRLKDYNISEEILALRSGENLTHPVKKTTENWTYQLEIESTVDRPVAVEVTDTKPREAEILVVDPAPTESTATSLKWEVTVLPRQKLQILYSYRMVRTETLID
ncbi:MAG: hypothetical protein A4E45_01192 [Methanosaeta sp. PtaB.Bin039]|nr:MAG: hypothetical protein A4E45_01192 [Methanosaeta sp. PtaB.Bin039]OPY45528.1 MAG: hypothetical protein A4E47_00945 [Methanosaeta sp. PtaU1.Bin028]HOT07906.1 hypothetical protein [Methanotrichaceae archaeon]HQF17675.1 hypothetical protein [Methanotrichaceae archaeon]HQI92278.1 hypothetical protein [Methanotrichaceae archaeon]